VRGVVDRPSVEGRCIEYIHQSPGDFLTLDSLLKKNQLDDVYFEFQADRAIIAAADAPREQACPDLLDIRSKIFCVIDATKANSYYVAGAPRRWRLRREVLEPIFHSSDQTLTKIIQIYDVHRWTHQQHFETHRAMMVPTMLPYQNAGQIISVTSGAQAGEMETLVKVPARGIKSADVITLTHLLCIAYVAIGNIAYLGKRFSGGSK